MTAITITDLENAKLDADHIASIATSLANTATDRVGNVKQTMAGAVGSIAAINNRGSWVTATSYLVKDLVSNSGTWYVCVVAHTASASFATDASSKWRVYQGVIAADLAAPTGSGLVGYMPAGAGAVARTLQDKGRESVSVKDFGAAGDGVLDDLLFIRAAALAAKAGKKALYIPPGDYLYSDTLTFDGISVYGVPGKSRLISTDATKSAIGLLGDRPSVYGLSIIGSATIAGLFSAYGFKVDTANDWSIDNCEIDHVGFIGIKVGAGVRGSITNNKIRYAYRDGIQITGVSSDIVIGGNVITNTGDDGIAVVGYVADGGYCKNIAINGNVVNGGAARGIAIMGVKGCTVTGNTVEGKDRYGILVGTDDNNATYEANDVVVTGNTVQNCTGQSDSTGLFLMKGATRVLKNIAINGNTFNSYTAKNRIDGGINIKVKDNIFGNVGAAGIEVSATNGFEFEGNTVHDTAGGGVVVNASCTGIVRINKNIFKSINSSNNVNNDVVYVNPSVATDIVYIQDNFFKNEAAYTIGRLVQCALAGSVVSGNYSPTLNNFISSVDALVPQKTTAIGGTYIPTVVGTTVSGSGTYQKQFGSYQVVGRWVIFNICVTWSTHTGTGTISVSLPIAPTPNSNREYAVNIHGKLVSGVGQQLSAEIAGGLSFVYLHQVDPATAVLSGVPMQGVGQVLLSGMYETVS